MMRELPVQIENVISRKRKRVRESGLLYVVLHVTSCRIRAAF